MAPLDLASALHVACAWSAIIEPGDEAAGILRRYLGDAEALEWLLSKPAVDSLPRALILDKAERPRPWTQVIERWLPRIDTLNVDKDLEALDRVGGHVVFPGHPRWPSELDDLELTAPSALWVRGSLSARPRISIVGARASTALGNATARDFAWELAREGIDIVSGGAFGIDAAAHRGALTGGRTTAFMAGGVANLYPISHLDMFDDIIANGAVVSESPPHWRPARWRFLARNRLIAAYSHACVVIEAAVRSGALATIRRAIDLNRPVGAVPGPITSAASRGCHDMIRNGATLVTSATEVRELIDDIGDHLFDLDQRSATSTRAMAKLTDTQRRVFDALPAKRGTVAAQVARIAGLGIEEVLRETATLAMKGIVTIDGEHIRRA